MRHFYKIYFTCTLISYSELLLLFDIRLHSARWQRSSTVDDSTYPLLANLTSDSFFYKLLQKYCKKVKNIFNSVVQFQRRKPHNKLRHETISKPPRAKRPPTIDGAEQPARFRGRHPTAPTNAFFLSFQRPTSFQNNASIDFH